MKRFFQSNAHIVFFLSPHISLWHKQILSKPKSNFQFMYPCSTLELWKTRIDAVYNYWGFNTTLAVSGRIRDLSDDPRLLEVQYTPFYMNNATILDGKCPPGWNLVGDTCYMYIGAPMTFYEARAFCQVIKLRWCEK